MQYDKQSEKRVGVFINIENLYVYRENKTVLL